MLRYLSARLGLGLGLRLYSRENRAAWTIVASVLTLQGSEVLAGEDFICDPDGEQVCAVAETGMKLRVLMRPGATILVDMDEASAPAAADVQPQPLSVYNVFDAKDVSYDQNFAAEGWFRVGSADIPDGYIQAKDVVPWKQALALAFTNPGPADRKPVLMFQNEESLTETVKQILIDPTVGESIFAELGQGPAPNGIVSRERSTWVDVTETFYLLPILQFSDLSQYAPGLTAVQFAALTSEPEAAQGQACDLQQAGGNECLQEQSAPKTGALTADIVFVIDTTSSMQPYIDAVTGAIREMSQVLAQKAGGADALRFGVVGYRDALEASPGIEYTAKSFTPNLLPVDEFQALLDQGQVVSSPVGSDDWEEDVFAGMELGIGSTWSETGARIVILIGDASSHPVGHPKNTRGLSEASIRQLAEEQNVYVTSIYISGDENATDLALARPQFEEMASGAGESAASFSIVDASSSAGGSEGGGQGLESSLRTVMSNLSDLFTNGNVGALMAQNTNSEDKTAQAVMGTVRAAVVDYLGSEASPPPSIIAWAVDHDLTAFEKQALDVRVLVDKSELQTLSTYLEGVLEEFRGEKTSSTSFLSGVVAGAATTSLDLSISDAEPLMNSPQAPIILKGLPYKSEVLSISLEEFRAASAEDRARFEARLEALVSLYNDIDRRPESWVSLNPNAGVDEKVYMLKLGDLP